jgi:hypothetical protein
MKYLVLFLCVYLFSCVHTEEMRTYFCFENQKVCVSKDLLVKLFPDYISNNVGDEYTALFYDHKTEMGQYVLLQRESRCWEVADLYPFSQNVYAIKLLKLDSLVVWYELYPGCAVT